MSLSLPFRNMSLMLYLPQHVLIVVLSLTFWCCWSWQFDGNTGSDLTKRRQLRFVPPDPPALRRVHVLPGRAQGGCGHRRNIDCSDGQSQTGELQQQQLPSPPSISLIRMASLSQLTPEHTWYAMLIAQSQSNQHCTTSAIRRCVCVYVCLCIYDICIYVCETRWPIG